MKGVFCMKKILIISCIISLVLLAMPIGSLAQQSLDQSPEITLINPQEGYFHFSGIALFELKGRFLPETMGFGGFRVRPVQVEILDEDDPAELTVTLYANGVKERDMTYNEQTGLFEGKWIGPALGNFEMIIIAQDSMGNIDVLTKDVWYFCFVPEM